MHGGTLVEEHITGIPGDTFPAGGVPTDARSLTRVAKEFVKFSERSFAKLLGDMRGYNDVIVLTQDFDMAHYRVRAIDRDRRSYEGDIRIYLPQFYKENRAAVDALLTGTSNDAISTSDRVEQLAADLARYHRDPGFDPLRDMGRLTRRHRLTMLRRLETT